MIFKAFDIHSHLNFPQFDSDRDAVIARMRAASLGTITVGVDLATSQEAVALAHAHEHLFATVGVHPTDTQASFDEGAFLALVSHAKVVAVGECGLDYYRSADTAEKERQKELFAAQIAFAHAQGKPLMIHGRPARGSMDAYEDILEIIHSTSATTHPAAENAPYAGNVHFFVGTIEIARQFLDAGFSLSFDGPITFARDYDEVIRYVPDDRIMVETDAPFAAPEPFRGTRNEPLFVDAVIGRVAAIRGISAPDCQALTLKNALRCFGIPSGGVEPKNEPQG